MPVTEDVPNNVQTMTEAIPVAVFPDTSLLLQMANIVKVEGILLTISFEMGCLVKSTPLGFKASSKL